MFDMIFAIGFLDGGIHGAEAGNMRFQAWQWNFGLVVVGGTSRYLLLL